MGEQEIQLRAEIGGYLGQVAGIRVVDQETSTAAQVGVGALKGILKRWKEYWKEPKDKAKSVLDSLRAKEAELADRIQPQIDRLSKEIVDWTVAERRKAAEAEEKRRKAEWEARRAEEAREKTLAAAVDFEDVPAPAAVELPPPAVKPLVNEVQMRDNWTWEVEDFERIPRRFLKVDEGAITREVKALRDKAEIPGIRVRNKPILASRKETI